MYQEHDIEISEFNEQDVFANIADEASEDGEGTHSFIPDSSDI